jgi:Skp family chaperone for outer membrane proteins
MSHSIFWSSLPLILVITILAGCNYQSSKPQAVVVDRRALLEAAGIDERIKRRLEQVNQEISAEIKALSDKLSKELADRKSMLGDNPSQEDMKKIQNLRQQLREQIAQARFQGNARRAKERAQIRQSLIGEIVPIAEAVAREHGASIILTSQSGVFWFDESIDITDEVIAQLPRLSDGEQH